MIRYALSCPDDHAFESWFPSSAAYDAQNERGLVECPVCGSTTIRKALMAPALGRPVGEPSRPAAAAPSGPIPADPASTAPAAAVPPAPVALLSDGERAMRAMLRAVREHVTRTADYVGTDFPDQARRMHYGDAAHRSIYGEASPHEAKALRDEGIDVHAIPILPEDRN